MKQVSVSITLLSYWHAGTGLGRGGDVDKVVRRDGDGLPFLPGKSLKGLFRDAAWLLEQCGGCAEGTTRRLFGGRMQEEDELRLDAGTLRFADARMNGRDRDSLLAQGESARLLAAGLFTTISSTSLTEEGVARAGHLRSVEAAIPFALEGSVSGPDDPAWMDTLGLAAGLVRALGSHRHRGLGRCRVTVAPALLSP